MTASTKTTQNHTWFSRLIVSLTIGLMMLALGATTAFAGTGIQTTPFAANAAPVISTGGDKVALNEDDGDDEDDDDEDGEGGSGGGGGGGLPATDTAPVAATGIAISTGAKVTLNEDDGDDEDDDDEDGEGGSGGGGGGGLPA